jgi:glycosyltransferase involved in cell wall biosynthesis
MTEISVIIPLLNKGAYIKRAIVSVLSQEYQNFEIIVVEGGSTDDGPDIVRSIEDERIKLIRQPGKGVSDARNFGVEKSKGYLVAFLDADDEWLPRHLIVIMKLNKKFPEAGAYTTAYKICTKNGKLRWPKYRAIPPPPWEGLLPNYFFSAVRGEYPVWTSAVCIPKAIFTDAGGFPVDAQWGEDADLWGKIALKYPIAFSWELGAIYHWNSLDRACNRPSLQQEPFVKTAQNLLAAGEIPTAFLPYLKEYMNKKEIFRAACLIFCGFSEEAKSLLKKCKTKDFIVRKTFLCFLSYFPSPISHWLLKKVLNFYE